MVMEMQERIEAALGASVEPKRTRSGVAMGVAEATRSMERLVEAKAMQVGSLTGGDAMETK